MSLPIVFLLYALSGALLVYFSIKCADYVDLLDKKTDLSGAFIGGVILAAVTSLPELVTSISSIYVVHNEELIIGNVLGSNIFNLCIFGAATALSVKAFSKAGVGKSHFVTLICTIIADILMVATLMIDPKYTRIPYININAASLVILVIYFISLKYLSGDETKNEEEENSPLTVKQIVVRFVFTSLGLVGMSIIVTYFTDMIQEKINLGASLAGAIFLGVVTSLPELASSVTLVRKHNFNAMVGNVLGSNMFNFTIFSIADFIAGNTIIYKYSGESMYMIVFGVLSSLFVIVSLAMQARFKKLETVSCGKKTMIVILGIAICASYLASMVIPTL